jgi:hypothetical protein
MSKRQEEIGMTDAQYKDRVRDWIAELERILTLGVSDKARDEIEAEIERRKKVLED